MDLSTLDTWRHTVITPSGPLSYLDVGTGRPVLFVHGLGTSSLLWRTVIGELHDRYRCIAVDLPLHGGSPAAPDQDFRLPALARAVAEAWDAIGLDDADVVANDTGGAVAQILVTRRPERTRTLALTNCESHDNVPPAAFQPTVDLAAAGQLAPGASALVADPALARATAFAMGYQDPEALDLEVVHSWVDSWAGTEERARQFERFLTSLHAQDLLDIEPALKALEVPTLLVWGNDDPTFPMRDAHWLRDTIPGVTGLVELDGGKLFFPDERGAELAALLVRHFEAH